MKHKLFYSLLLITVSLLTLHSCVDYKEVKIVGIKDVQVEKISQEGIKAKIFLQINNPNDYKISVVDSDLDLYLNGVKMGKAILKDKIKLNKTSDEIYGFRVETSFKEAGITSLPALMAAFTGGTIQVRAKGNIKARAYMVSKKVDMDFSEMVKI